MNDTERAFIAVTEFPVRYAETDAMAVVHHANYLIYFEAGRSDFLRQLGCEYAALEAQGYRLPVTETGVRYLRSLRYGQNVRIHTRLEENRSRQLSFSYEAFASDSNSKLVSGFTRHIWTNSEGGVISRPESWLLLCRERLQVPAESRND